MTRIGAPVDAIRRGPARVWGGGARESGRVRARTIMIGATTAVVMAALVFAGIQLGQNPAQAPPAPGHEDAMDGEHKHTNRLIDQPSPYLQQHAHNPVNWYPWGDEALQKAKDEDKPILVSIGYSSCHWCHVMERESFENEDIAAIMNEHFICIKVDREERPDLDELYMNACQMITGSGGWPLNVFLTPDLKPFYAGTYFPPDDKFGRPGWPSILQRVAEVFAEKRDEIDESAEQITAALASTPTGARGEVDYALIDGAISQFSGSFDERWGGFGGAPKFPSSKTISLLLRQHRRTGDARSLEMATVTLDRMAQGGMYDQLGGGFHRYSVDEKWLVPHFEKMLYDNAQLADVYLEAFQATGDPYYEQIAREILDYVVREMTDAAGGFHSTTDADSEGEEGKFFVWSLDEVTDILGKKDAELFADFYEVTEGGNFEGHSILNIRVPLDEFAKKRDADPDKLWKRLDAMRGELLAERVKRVPPGLDDKVLADWNGLMITAFARGYQVTGDERYRDAAIRAAEFVLTDMSPDGRLRHAYRQGTSYLDAFLDDYAFVIAGLLDLYEATFDPKWAVEAQRLTDEAIAGFWDDASGGFYFTRADQPHLITRPKKLFDGATPGGNSIAAGALLRLARLTGNADYAKRATDTLAAVAAQAARIPRGFPALLVSVSAHLDAPTEVVIAGAPGDAETQALVAAARKPFIPNRLVVVADPTADGAAISGVLSVTQAKGLVDGKPAAYVCDARGCLRPTTSPDELADLLAP